jgi:phage FluMu protein Com
VEASIDCHVCGRRDRTVEFGWGNRATCRKTGHAVGGGLDSIAQSTRPVDDPGELVNPTAMIVDYAFRWDYEPFTEESSGIPSRKRADGGRVYFTLKCPKCNTVDEFSTQQNLVRPSRIQCRHCNHLLAIDRDTQPTMETPDQG